MKKLYEKNQLSFAIAWIAGYCFLQSLANPLSAALGVDYLAQALVSALLSIVLLSFLLRNRLMGCCGLGRASLPAKKLLYYLPLVLLISSNLWFGLKLSMSPFETFLYIYAMFFVGFLEEVIFRGFLFKALAKDSVKSAVLVSSLSFGLGHLLNLVNGSGMGLLANLCQVFSAVAVGLLFVLLFYKSGSLIPCIITHSAINMLSAFTNESAMTDGRRLLQSLAVILIALGYSLYLSKIELRAEGPCGACRACSGRALPECKKF